METAWPISGRRLPLGAKIALPYFLLTLLVGVGGTFVATRLASQSANDRLTPGLVEAIRAADADCSAGTGGSRPSAPCPTARAGRGGRRRDTAPSARPARPAAPGRRLGALVDALAARWLRAPRAGPAPRGPGRLVGGARRPPRAGPAGRRDFSGDRQGGLGDLDGEPALVAVAPLRLGDRVVGALVVGSDLVRDRPAS